MRLHLLAERRHGRIYSNGPLRISLSQSQEVENQVSETWWTSWPHMRDSNQILSGLWKISLRLRIQREVATAPSGYNESSCLQDSGKTRFCKRTRFLGHICYTHLGHDGKGAILEKLKFQSKSSEIAGSSTGVVLTQAKEFPQKLSATLRMFALPVCPTL